MSFQRITARRLIALLVAAVGLLDLPSPVLARGFGGGRIGGMGGGFHGGFAGGLGGVAAGGYGGAIGGLRNQLAPGGAEGGFGARGLIGPGLGGGAMGGLHNQLAVGGAEGGLGPAFGGPGLGGPRIGGAGFGGLAPFAQRMAPLGPGPLAGGFGAASALRGPVSAGRLDSFLGLPSDEGLHNLNRLNADIAGRSDSRAEAFAAGFTHMAPSARYRAAAAVRRGFADYGLFGPQWLASHPAAWHAANWEADSGWQAAEWNELDAWLGDAVAAPMDYDYGQTVTYDDDTVSVNNQDVGTSDDYYNQAATLATSGTAADASSDEQWLPLGVFALTKGGEDKSDVTLQLAVNKQGIIRGNSTDAASGRTQLVHGSVDKSTQRVAFTVGDKATTVVETGLYNLTKDEVPALIHFGPDRTEQWLLVRLTKPDASAQH